MIAERSWAAPLLVASLAAMLVAALGATMTDLGPWYQALAKPDWSPPDIAFPLAWTFIFGLTVLAAATAWRAAYDSATKDWLIILFAMNGTLNIVWSILFFRLQRPDWAILELGVLWISIVVLLAFTARFSKLGAALLLPYLIWVSTAGLLNWNVIELNGPFG